jgi:hypothetical protein
LGPYIFGLIVVFFSLCYRSWLAIISNVTVPCTGVCIFLSLEFLGLGLADLGKEEHAELNPDEHDDEWGGCDTWGEGREPALVTAQGEGELGKGRELAPLVLVVARGGRDDVGDEEGGERGNGSARQLTVSWKI